MLAREVAGRLHVEIGRSRRLALAILLIHVIGAFAVALVDMPVGYRFALAVLGCVSLRHAWRHDVALTAPGAVVALTLDADEGWVLHTRSGAPLRVRPAPECLVHPQLSLLLWRGEGGPRVHLALCADALDADAYRRLRIAFRAHARSADDP